jgi:putative transposase
MVQYRRNLIAGGTYFFTVNLQDRRRALLVEHIDDLRSIVREVQAQLPFSIDAMVVLPDHWHAVWTLPPNDAGYSRRIQLIKAKFTSHLLRMGENIEKDARGEYRLWQKRYWEHTIRDEPDFEAHVNYVHINPVKHGHVVRPIDWLHSTLRKYVDYGLLPADWTCATEDGQFGE